MNGYFLNKYDAPANVYVRELLKSKGYDSYLYQNLHEDIGGWSVGVFDNDGNKVEIKVAPKTKYRNESGNSERANRHLTNYLDNPIKQETLMLVDEVISTAKLKNKETAELPHDWLDNKGKNKWEVWTTYIQDKENTIWEAKLQITNSTNGDKILYDIHPTKEVGPGRTMPEKPTKDNILQNGPESQDKSSETTAHYSDDLTVVQKDLQERYNKKCRHG